MVSGGGRGCCESWYILSEKSIIGQLYKELANSTDFAG